MKWRRPGSARPGTFGPKVDGWLADATVPGQQWRFYGLVSLAGLAFAALWALGLAAFEWLIGRKVRW